MWPAFEDFRNFLFLVWRHLGLPEPTPAQYEVAHRLQWGVDSVELHDILADMLSDGYTSVEGALAAYQERLYERPMEDIIRAFRSLGKSYITSAYVIWRLMRNPRDEKVLVLSATASKAKEFVDQTRGILESMEMVQWLFHGPRESGARRRDMADRFDVAGSSLSQSYSVKASGVDGQITGSRATLIIPDDIETIRNSKTEEGRAGLRKIIASDLGPIRKTEHGQGDIIFLGTPQTEESIYNVLVKEMGFRSFCIPVRYPTAEKVRNYTITRDETGEEVDLLAYYLRRAVEVGELSFGALADTRYTDEELFREEAKGRAAFALQYMLDTSLSDAERYPLKQHDLIVFSTNPTKAPLTVQWGRHTDKLNYIKDISNVGFSGDHFLRPLFIDSEWRPYEGLVLWVDPSGRGADETAWAVVGHLTGTFYLLHMDGIAGDPAEAMRRVALDAKKWNVNVIEIEPNYAQGVWIEAFRPILAKVWPSGCAIQESEWAKGQKESRIIGTLEPVMSTHRLVVSEELIRADIERAKRGDNPLHSLMYQLTHITHERHALKHDDRLEALAGGVAYFTKAIGQDTQMASEALLDQEREEEIENFWDIIENGPGRLRGRYRGRGVYDEVVKV